jgi:prevent-host-death family protein
MDHQMVCLADDRTTDLMVHGGAAMEVSVTEAKGQLTELVRRAEAGDEVILTRHGHPTVRLVPVKTVPDRKSRRRLLEAARASGAAKAKAGPDAARSQDFLYGDDGLPE